MGGDMKSLILTLTAIMILFLGSCEDSNDPLRDTGIKRSTINIVSNLDQDLVAKIKKGTNPILSNDVDSIKIENARILISRMILHELDTDENEDSPVVFIGPNLLVFHPDSGDHFVGTVEVEPLTYDKIKFEMHRFDASEISEYADNPTFSDFATGDRYSVIINGDVYKGEEITPFLFNGQVTANLTVDFYDFIELDENDFATISIELDPNVIFTEGGILLDPNDPKNSNHIENNIKEAFKALKK
jgi:hypothetical protein